MSAVIAGSTFLPAPITRLVSLLDEELRDFPGRSNVLLRSVIASALVIVASMTLHVPFLALSLIVVFYITQANITASRLIGLMLIAGCTLAVAAVIGLLALTFDYPLLRIAGASVIFFCSVYLMRVAKTGIVFFIVALIVIYVQTFVDLTDNAEVLVRSCLWVWAAVNYPIMLSLLVNAWLLPAEPIVQLKAELNRQLALAIDTLACHAAGHEHDKSVGPLAIQRGAASLQKLLRFCSMQDSERVKHDAKFLAVAATVSRIFQAAWELKATRGEIVSTSGLHLAIRAIQSDCAELARCISTGQVYCRPWNGDVLPLASLQEMRRALNALGVAEYGSLAGQTNHQKAPFLTADAWTNPVYARFALRTLLAVFICYVFYNAVRWPGIHTIMLSCLICALPTNGAARLHGLLRIVGALIGSALAVLIVVFVLPHVDGIVGLLALSLPVIAAGAWIAAGSERVSYAGVQMMVTFALALLEQYSPVTDLTEIRDRAVGVLLGVAVCTFLQTVIWPEGEAALLRDRLASVLRGLATSITEDREARSIQTKRFQRWAQLADCEAMLARVTLEPDWREGEQDRVALLTQTVLVQTRSIMLASDALQGEVSGAVDIGAHPNLISQAEDFRLHVGRVLEAYARALAENPPEATRPSTQLDALLTADMFDTRPSLLEATVRLDRELTGLPDWRELRAREVTP